MSFGSFVCQNNIKFQLKQPVVVYIPTNVSKKKKKMQPKADCCLYLQRHLKFVSSKRNLYKRKKDREREREKKILVRVCFDFCSKIYAIVRNKP